MKILLTSDTYENQICGVSTSIETLKEELIKKGHDVRVLLLSKDRRSKIKGSDYLIGSFSFHIIDFRQSIRFHDKVIDEIILWNPDIVHIQTEWFGGLAGKKIARKCGCPYINTSHTSWENFTKGFIPTDVLRTFLSKRLLLKNYNKSSAVIAPSHKMANLLKSIGVNLPTYVVPTGIDLEFFCENLSSHDENELRKDLGINESTRVLLYLGRVGNEKNLDELMEYFSDLIEKDPNIVLLIVGEGPHLKKLKDCVKKLKITDNVRFTGVVQHEDTCKYYKLADIFVSPSTCETQGITYMEALASSLPLVCRYDEALDDVLENGYNGFFYTDKKEFIDCVSRILSSDEYLSELGANARKSSLKFSKKDFADRVEEIYLQVSPRK